MSEVYEDILDLESQVKSLNEINKGLNMTYAQLTRKSLEYLKQIKELEEDKRKLISMITQGNQKFEKMLTMGKESGDRSGLGYNTSNTSNYNKSQSNAFVKGKAKLQIPTQPPKQRPWTHSERQFQKGKKPITYKHQVSSQKHEGFRDKKKGQVPLQKPKAFDNRHNTSYKGKVIDTSQASTSKSKMSYGTKPHSFF